MDPLEELEQRLYGQPALAEPSVRGRKRDGGNPFPISRLYERLRAVNQPTPYAVEQDRVNHARSVLENPLLENVFPPGAAQRPLPNLPGQPDPMSPSLMSQLAPMQQQMQGAPSVAIKPTFQSEPEQPYTSPPIRTGTGAGMDKFSPDVAAYLQNHPFGGNKRPSNLERALRPPSPNGYTYGFGGGELTPGAEERINRALATVRPGSTPGGLTASQKRQLAVPVGGQKSMLEKALADEMLFGNATDKAARAANKAKGLDINQTNEGLWRVAPAGTPTDRLDPELSALERRVTAKKGTITPEQEAAAKRLALQRTRLKAKRGGVLMAGADENSSLAEIKNAEAEIEKRIANKKMGLPEDKGIGLGNQVAGNLSPQDAGIAAVQKAKEAKAAELGIPVKFVKLTAKEGEVHYEGGYRAREAELARQGELTRQKILADAQAAMEEKRLEAERTLAEKNREFQGWLSKAEIESREKIAAREAEDRQRGFDLERDQKVVEASRNEWAAAHGGRGPRTPRERAEVNQIVQDRIHQRDTKGAPAPGAIAPTGGFDIGPLDAQRRLNEELQAPGDFTATLGLLGVGADAKAPDLAKALEGRMKSESPLPDDTLDILSEYIRTRDSATPDYYDKSMTRFGANPFLNDPGVGPFLMDELYGGLTSGGGPEAMERAKARYEQAKKEAIENYKKNIVNPTPRTVYGANGLPIDLSSGASQRRATTATGGLFR